MSVINAPVSYAPLASEARDAKKKIRRFPPGGYYELVNRAAEKAGVEFTIVHGRRRGSYGAEYRVGTKRVGLKGLIEIIERKLGRSTGLLTP